tara:strand:+ start:177 stop:341 length:165 start_codon:yes stop_codon:yes gene_type:complete
MPGMPSKKKAAQAAMLKKHAQHHSDKHMALMRKLMSKGMTFNQAHKVAQKEAGK